VCNEGIGFATRNIFNQRGARFPQTGELQEHGGSPLETTLSVTAGMCAKSWMTADRKAVCGTSPASNNRGFQLKRLHNSKLSYRINLV
jgi:hypothetical protein